MNKYRQLNYYDLIISYRIYILISVFVVAVFSFSLALFSDASQAQAAETMMVYDTQTITATPKYRIWDGSAWGSEQSASNVNGEIAHEELKYAPTRDEAILVIQTSTGEISAQIYNGSSWGTPTVLSTITSSPDQQAINGRCFDVFYEQTSGDAIVVYCDNTADPDYKIWNGSSWSSATNINIPTTGITNTMETVAKSGSDEGALITLDANSDVYGMRWTGSAWDSMGVSTTWETTASLATKKPIDVAYETNSGDIMFTWGYATVATAHFRYRAYSGGALGAVTNVTNAQNGGVVHWLQLSSDPTSSSNKIMIAVEDAGADINTFEWSGTAWSAVQTEHTAAAEDVATMNFNLTYETYTGNGGNVWLTFGNGSTVTRKRWAAGAWGTSTTAGDDTAATAIVAQPNSGAVLAMTYQDNTSATDDITSFEITGGGTTWSSPATVWGGPVARNLGYKRIDMAAQAYGGSNEAMMVYDTQTTTTTPKYRLWNGTSWGSEQSASVVHGDVYDMRVEYSPTRNEAILVTYGSTGDIEAQVWNGTSWGSPTLIQNYNGGGLGPDLQATYGRAFDIQYENTSGDAIIVYADNTADPNYKVWNGSTWSSATNIDIPTTGQIRWLKMADDRKSSSDNLAFISIDANVDVYGMYWNGSSWGNMGTSAVWDATAGISTREAIGVTFESTSGDAMFLWSDATSTDYYYRTYASGVLSAATLLDVTNAGGIGNWIKLASDYTSGSDKIMLGMLDAGSDLNTVEWSGTAWGAVHAEHSAGTEDIVDRNFDLTYETHSSNPGDAWLVWGNGSTVSRKKWDSGAWQTATTAGDDTATMYIHANPQNGDLLSVAYEDNTSASKDILSWSITGGGTTWSSSTSIWGGPVARNMGVFRVDMASSRFSGISISGTCDGYDQTTDCTDVGEIKVAVNGVLQAQSQPTVAGSWTVTGVTVPNNAIVTVFIDSASTNADKAVAITKYAGSGDITGVKLFAEHISIGSNQNTSITNSDLAGYDNTNDTDIIFEASASAFSSCNGSTMSGNGGFCSDPNGYSSKDRVYIDSGDTWVTGADAVLTKLYVAGAITVSTSTQLKLVGRGDDTTCGTSTQMPLCVTGTFGGAKGTAGDGSGIYFAANAGSATIPALDYDGNVYFPSADATWTIGSGTLTALRLSLGASAGATYNFNTNNPTVNAKDLVVETNATLNAGSGTWTLSGVDVSTPAITSSGTFNGNTSTFVVNSTYNSGNMTIPAVSFYNLTLGGAETYELTGATTILNNLNINASATLDAVTGSNYGLTIGGNFTEAGTFTARQGAVVFNDNSKSSTISGAPTFYNLTTTTAGKDLLFTAGETIVVNGLLTLTGGSGAGQEVTLNSTTGSSAWTINHQGTESITYATVTWSACDGSSTTITATGTGNVDGGNNGSCWQLPFIVSGTLYQKGGVTPDTTGYTIYLSVNAGNPYSTTSDGSGLFAFSSIPTLSAGDILTIWGNGITGSSVIKYGNPCNSGKNCTAISLTKNTLNLYSFNGSSITNTDLENCDANNAGLYCATSDIGFDSDSGSMILLDNSALKVNTGTTFAPGGDVDADELINTGTYNGATGVLTVYGDFASTGTFTHGNGDVVLTDGSRTSNVSGSISFYNLTIASPNKHVNFASGSTITTNGLLTITGSKGKPVVLNSSTGSSAWTINHQGTESITYVTVKWSACHGSSADITLTSTSRNGGNNGGCWGFYIFSGGGSSNAPVDGGTSGGSGGTSGGGSSGGSGGVDGGGSGGSGGQGGGGQGGGGGGGSP